MLRIELKNIKPTYMSDNEVAKSDVYLKNITLEQANKYLIKANSGQGKSSILNFIYGSNRQYDGSIAIKYSNEKEQLTSTNTDTSKSSISSSAFLESLPKFRKSVFSYVFQDFKLFSQLTLWDNIKIKNNLTNYKTDEQIKDLINQVGLSEKEHQAIETLSLGQRQRVAIIRALCQPFKYLLLDEPFSHLDEDNISILTKIIEQELEIQKAGLVITTLNNEYLFKYDKILKL